MTDDLGFVVHAFHRSIVDSHVEVIEDIVLMAAQHPGEITHGFEA